MRYEILGPLRIVDGTGNAATISAHKVEVLLATLLIRSDQVVTVDQLISEIWDRNPPLKVRASLHVYVSQLRKMLTRPGVPAPIVTLPAGYMLRVGPDSLDLPDFQRLMCDGRTLSREGLYPEAARAYESALALLRGPVLGDLSEGPIVRGFVTWLEEARIECTEMGVEAQLALGRHRELIGDLYALTAEYPLRESFHRQLMLALYRAERQADALRVYQDVRRVLREELGIEPGRALRRLQHAILADDDELNRQLAG